jgi:hypothetical protein
MPFKLTDDHIDQYSREGYVVFHSVLPTSLVRDLRRESEKARVIARKVRGVNAQRLQPICEYAELDQKPFEAYATLPVLVDAVKTLVGPDAWMAGPSRMGILFEPAERPWATTWHRDFGPYQQRVDPAVFALMRSDPRYFHQVNCALYDEDCTWYVPGSYLRADFADEAPLGRDYPWQIGMDQEGLTNEELERFCLDYVEKMPRGIRLALTAGDFALYRPHGWHLGLYAPYKKRATLHDSVWTPPWKAAFERWGAGGMMEPTTDEMMAAAAGTGG